MVKKYHSVLKEVLNEIKPEKKELNEIKSFLRRFLKGFKEELKVQKINADIFVGGSLAKGTLIKKDQYDVDIFVRFDRKYKNEEISEITWEVIKKFKDVTEFGNILRVHGSRDYFIVKNKKDFFLEIIPVKKIQKPEDAENITDLSYAHVHYVKKKIQSRKIVNDILLAKAFCHANNCYGAESYIRGFSGYSLELLVYYYKGFLNFIRSIARHKEGKIVIDIEKHFKSKQEILMNMNSSKLKSPIILIDPTYRQRNALAALSDETFSNFKKACREFIRNPSKKAFQEKKISPEKIMGNAEKKGLEFVLLEIETDRQEGDIAGSKLQKFYRHLGREIGKFFDVKNKGFAYNNGKNAQCFFSVKRKKEILFHGPYVKDSKNLKMFRKKHKKVFVKSGKAYAKEKVEMSIIEFMKRWKSKNRKIIKSMAVTKVNIVKPS